jgi:hypothetical protein
MTTSLPSPDSTSRKPRKEPSTATIVAWTAFELFFYVFNISVVGAVILSTLWFFHKFHWESDETMTIGGMFFVAMIIALTYKLSCASLAEPIKMISGGLEHILVRLFTVLVGASDTSKSPKRRAVRIHIFSIVLAIIFGWTAIHYLIDDEITQIRFLVNYGVAFNRVSVGATLVVAFKVGASIFIALAPFRLIFAGIYKDILDRPIISKIESGVEIQGNMPSSYIPKETDEHKSTNKLVIAHLSDIHIGGPLPANERRASNKTPWLRACLNRVMDELRRNKKGVLIDKKLVFSLLDDVGDVDGVVVSGDITDAGSEEAWEIFREAIEEADIKRKVIMAPGNHDLNMVHLTALDTIFKWQGAALFESNKRALRYLETASAVMGSRALLICPFTKVVSTLPDVLERAKRDIDEWLAESMNPDSLTPLKLLELAFPMIVSMGVDADKANIRFVIWNSVKNNRWAVFNAIGHIGKSQILRMDELSRSLPSGTSLIHVIHHQLGLPKRSDVKSRQSGQWLRSFSSQWMTLENPALLVRWLRARRQKTLILHGHHHKFFVASTIHEKATVVSAPSPTVGCEESYHEKCTAGQVGRWLRLLLTHQGGSVDLISVDVVDIKG